jgi:hypothetical protein
MKTDALKQAMSLNPLIANPYKNLILKKVTLWSKRSGFTWSDDRCKTIITYLLKLRAGEQVERPTWISASYLNYAEKVTKVGSWSKFSQLISVWRVFTALPLEERKTTQAQIQKFETAVQQPPHIPLKKYEKWKNHPYLTFTMKDILGLAGVEAREISDILPEVHIPRVIPVRNPLSLRTQITINGKKHMSTEWQELIHDSHVLPLNFDLMRLPSEQRPFALKQIPILYLDPESKEYSDFSDGVIGNIRARIQKDGKTRFYYAPSQWEQFLLYPFAETLKSQNRRIPQDCTFEQEKGVVKIMEWLKEGKTVWSFDLSSATDRFPLALTRGILLGLKQHPNWRMWVNTFTILSRTYHKVSYAGSKAMFKSLKWGCGQPLGLNASFAAFALSHHAVVRGLYPGNPSEAPYVILGDDLVIADETLANRYRDVMQILHVEISETKSLHGCVGEFAGKFISQEGADFKVKYQYVTLRTLLNMINLVGPRALKGMRATPLRNVIALISTPRTPMGLNPGGFSMEKRATFLAKYLVKNEVEPAVEPLVDSITATLARDETVRAISPYAVGYTSTHAWNPTGSAFVGYGGVPETKSLTGSKDQWYESPYCSRAWLRRVKRLAKQADLL